MAQVSKIYVLFFKKVPELGQIYFLAVETDICNSFKQQWHKDVQTHVEKTILKCDIFCYISPKV